MPSTTTQGSRSESDNIRLKSTVYSLSKARKPGEAFEKQARNVTSDEEDEKL